VSIKVNDLQFENFKNICKEYNEFLVGDDDYLREQLDYALKIQGSWSGMAFRYYLEGDDWRAEERKFGSS